MLYWFKKCETTNVHTSLLMAFQLYQKWSKMTPLLGRVMVWSHPNKQIFNLNIDKCPWHSNFATNNMCHAIPRCESIHPQHLGPIQKVRPLVTTKFYGLCQALHVWYCKNILVKVIFHWRDVGCNICYIAKGGTGLIGIIVPSGQSNHNK